MMKNNDKRKGNNTKKLIPAAGMLALSASMLATSTYAWFTMSREVEVSNISMSATVPEDIQISLGRIGTIDSGTITESTKETDASLANGKGGLVNTSGVVAPPEKDWDWSNIADVSEYYQFGRLIPASSTNGANIFFTPDANGVGKTIATGARFFQATDNLTVKTQADVSATATNGTTPLSATAHIINAKSDGYVTDAWNKNTYATSVGWDNTQDDGYYIDIPVWFRTSSKDGAKLSVQAYVKPKTTTQAGGATNDEALYRAVRVAILDVGDVTDGGTYATTGTTKNLIPVADGWTLGTNGAAGTLDNAPFAMSAVTDSILNWYGRTVADGSAAATALTAATGTATGAKAAVASIDSNVPTYDKAVIYDAIYNADNNANNEVVTLAAPTYSSGQKGSNYGKAHKAVIRVWLEGEDPDCWNETAGQDWSINLKFNNEVNNKTTAYDGTDLTDVNQSTAPKPVPQNGG